MGVEDGEEDGGSVGEIDGPSVGDVLGNEDVGVYVG